MTVTPVIDLSAVSGAFVATIKAAGLTCVEYGAGPIIENDCVIIQPPQLDDFEEGEECWGQVKISTWPLELWHKVSATETPVADLNTLTENALTALRDDPQLGKVVLYSMPVNSPFPKVIGQGTDKWLVRTLTISVSHKF